MPGKKEDFASFGLNPLECGGTACRNLEKTREVRNLQRGFRHYRAVPLRGEMGLPETHSQVSFFLTLSPVLREALERTLASQ